MDFSRVLVTDKLAWELFGAAAREKLLFSRPGTEAGLPKRHAATQQRALSLLVLFDRLVVHDINDAFRLPDLEKDGLIESYRLQSHQSRYRRSGHAGGEGRWPYAAAP